MSIGYACITLGVSGTGLRTCTKKNATNDKIREIILSNLDALEHMIEYNRKNSIMLFRISSDLIPFGSDETNQIIWWEEFRQRFEQIGTKIKKYGMRVSMHPGQYTVLNSPREEVVERAIEDLRYHGRVLDALLMDGSGKIILHIGGAYGDKESAIRRFEEVYQELEPEIKKRLVIENDDRLFSIDEVVLIGEKLRIPVVFDALHHKVNPDPKGLDDTYWIQRCNKTWGKEDGKQKIHYSQQDPGKKDGSHSRTIRMEEFLNYYESIKQFDLDIMLEVKDKNLSAVKCNNVLIIPGKISVLEDEWARYKYLVLEKSNAIYQKIRMLLRDKQEYPAVMFYMLLEEAMELEKERGHVVNAAQHVWGYFNETATQKEKNEIKKLLQSYVEGEDCEARIKSFLFRLAKKYKSAYLLQSYYFLW